MRESAARKLPPDIDSLIAEVRDPDENQLQELELVKAEIQSNSALMSRAANFFAREYEAVRKVYDFTKDNPNRSRALGRLAAADTVDVLRLVEFKDPVEKVIEEDSAHAELLKMPATKKDEESVKRVAISRWGVVAKLVHKRQETETTDGNAA